MDLEMWPVDVSEPAKQSEEQVKQFVEPAENYEMLRLQQSLPTQRQVDYIATLAMRLFRDPVIELTAISTKAQASHKIDQLLDELKRTSSTSWSERCMLSRICLLDGQAERG